MNLPFNLLKLFNPINYTIPISQQEGKKSPFILQKVVVRVLYPVPCEPLPSVLLMLGVHSFAIEHNPNFAHLYPSTTRVMLGNCHAVSSYSKQHTSYEVNQAISFT